MGEQAGIVIYAASQLTLLVGILANQNSSVPLVTITVVLLDLVSSLGLLWLSTWAHWRSFQPSGLAVTYLLTKFVYYLLWITVPDPILARDERLIVIVKGSSVLLALLLESQNKRSILLDAYKTEPPEATTGPIGRVLFLWINPILLQGYHNILQVDDLPPLDRNLSSRNLRQAIQCTWNQRGSCFPFLLLAQNISLTRLRVTAKPENGATLPRVLLQGLRAPFLAAIVPRIFVIVFRFAQLLLISRTIRFVTSFPSEDDRLNGYWIVVAASIIYAGMAVSLTIHTVSRFTDLHAVNRYPPQLIDTT